MMCGSSLQAITFTSPPITACCSVAVGGSPCPSFFCRPNNWPDKKVFMERTFVLAELNAARHFSDAEYIVSISPL